MKIAILSESAADEAAIRILVDAILGCANERVGLTRFELRRGWPNVESIVPAVLKYVYYQTDGDALVIVVDSNGTPIHQLEHHTQADSACRLCKVSGAIADTRRNLRAVPGRAALKTAVGLACPAIEAWYHCGVDPHASEAAWVRDQAAGVRATAYVNKLKMACYGTDRPSLAMEIEAARREATRLAACLSDFEAGFPAGFGGLASEVRGWARAV